jgi:hypothetical protein
MLKVNINFKYILGASLYNLLQFKKKYTNNYKQIPSLTSRQNSFIRKLSLKVQMPNEYILNRFIR